MDLIIKPTEACNFKCSFCSSTAIDPNNAGLLDLDYVFRFLKRYPDTNSLIINGGDDYELLFTGKKGLDSNKNITEIGKMKKGRNINITDFDDITNLDGYKHKF